jgi:hypothetical protein
LVKLKKITLFNVLIAVFVRWLKNGSLAFAEDLACAVGAKANVPFAGWHKMELKKMCGGENKKYRRVGNECRLTRCPFVVSFLCLFSPVKMVYFFSVFSRLFVVVGSSFTLAANSFICITR